MRPVEDANGRAAEAVVASPVVERRTRTRRRGDAAPSAANIVIGAAALAILDKLSRGVFLLDESGMILHANRAADAMLKRGDGLSSRRGRLQLDAPGPMEEFQRFFAEQDHGSRDCLVLRLDGPRPCCPYRILVSALNSNGDRPVDGVACCVFVYEPNGGQRPLPVTVLRQLYGLSIAEARLANHLFLGSSLDEAARQGGISINTAKYTLKRIFDKCSVGSRAELLLLLSLGPRTL